MVIVRRIGVCFVVWFEPPSILSIFRCLTTLALASMIASMANLWTIRENGGTAFPPLFWNEEEAAKYMRKLGAGRVGGAAGLKATYECHSHISENSEKEWKMNHSGYKN